jgi:transposase
MTTTRMSQKELRAGTVISHVIAGAKTAVQAAADLGVTDRTVRRMKAKVKQGGLKALAHWSRGRPGNRRIPGRERARMELLLKERYPDFGPGLAAEKLRELHSIDRDPKTVRAAMVGLGLWQSGRRKRVAHRLWRERRGRYGELVQYDGSYEHWLEDRGGTGEICLLAAIDDATGTVPLARFAAHEGVLPTLGFWQEYAEEYGLPRSIYLDKFSTYRVNHGIASENQDTKTQVGRAMQDLGVELIFANSPQAKGRVERLFKTLQDRLIKELRLEDISSVEEANRFLTETFLPDFNRRFGRPAREGGDAHRTLRAEERRRLPQILCREDERTLANDFTIPHGKRWYQLLPSPRLALRPKDQVAVRTDPSGAVTLWVRGKPVNYRRIDKERDRDVLRTNLTHRTFLIPSHPDISISC